MRLLTARDNGHTSVWVETGVGFAAVPGFADVAELLRAGQAGSAAARAEIAHGGDRPFADFALAPPVIAPGLIVCAGQNYVEHAREGGNKPPSFPIVFSKCNNALIGCGDTIAYHDITNELDYEGELCAVIGQEACRVKRDQAMKYIAGFTIMNDISARDLQLGDLQWLRGKSLDTFAPTGPLFVSAEEVPSVAALRICTRVNGEVRQDASCAEMIFPLGALLEFITEAITLRPGDLVATGTPAGTGIGHKPPRYLQPGDTVEVAITGLGTLSNQVGQRPTGSLGRTAS